MDQSSIAMAVAYALGGFESKIARKVLHHLGTLVAQHCVWRCANGLRRRTVDCNSSRNILSMELFFVHSFKFYIP